MPAKRTSRRPALVLRLELSDDMAAALVIAAKALAAMVASTAEADALIAATKGAAPK